MTDKSQDTSTPEIICKLPDGSFPKGTKAEAERQHTGLLELQKVTFCPLTKTTCNFNCICYMPPEIKNVGYEIKPYFVCDGGKCNCYMLKGPA